MKIEDDHSENFDEHHELCWTLVLKQLEENTQLSELEPCKKIKIGC